MLEKIALWRWESLNEFEYITIYIQQKVFENIVGNMSTILLLIKA